MKKYIGIEAGGTKFVLCYGSNPDDISHRTVIKTQSPEITMPAVINYIDSIRQKNSIAAIGAAVFGPIDLDRQSSTYGYITSTTKTPWINYDFVGTLQKAFQLPVGFDTDVNTAALGEYRWGQAQGLQDFIYITVGTGIGVGAMTNGQLLHGAMHPEMGHVFVQQDKSVDSFAGVCPYHKNCLEGLASGPAMKNRWHVDSALDLPEDHPAWDLESYYLAQAIVNYTVCLAPRKVILGGGVMRQSHLLPKIRRQVVELINGYIKNPTVTAIDRYIVKAGLSDNAGVAGALALAELAEKNH